MIGSLPTALKINGIDHEIRSDYRNCLLILEAFNDPELTMSEKHETMLKILFKEQIPDAYIYEADEQAIWFLNCGNSVKESKKKKQRLYDWNQDEQMIFSAINKVAGREIRLDSYLHFWTFISYFMEIDDKSMFANVVSIRSKKQKKKKLEKHEQEFYRENKEIIELQHVYTKKEQEDIEFINNLLG